MNNKIRCSILQSRYFIRSLLCSFILSIISMILLIFFILQIVSPLWKNYISDLLIQSSSQLAATVSMRFTAMDDASRRMEYAYETYINTSPTVSNMLESSADLINTMAWLEYTYNIDAVSLYVDQSQIFSQQGIYFFTMEQAENMGLIISSAAGDLNWELIPDMQYPFMRFKEFVCKDVLRCYRWMRNINTNEKDFLYCIDVFERNISEILGRASRRDLKYFIVDAQGKIISHPDPDQLGRIFPDFDLYMNSSFEGQVDNTMRAQKLILPLSPTPWYLIADVGDEYFNIPLYSYVRSLISATVIMAVLSFAISFGLFYGFSKRLRQIAMDVRNFTREFSERHGLNFAYEAVDTKEEINDEIDFLELSFARMARQLSYQVNLLLEASHRQESLKHQLLRAKLNPHFLYNMLDSIKVCNSLKRSDEANALLDRLAQFYRMSFRLDKPLITLKEECEIVRLYLKMEAISHPNAFDWSIDICETADCLIPQFVLQPIVENSIVHGLDSRHTPMHIALHAYMDDDECITIIISDTGRGIRAEVLEALNCFLRQGAPDVNCYFGMSYAYYRLLPYKADCPPMIIESQNGGGTVITIRYKIII